MGDNIKMDIDRTIGLAVDANIINIVINIKDNENPIERDANFDPEFITGKDKYRVSKPINLINFFLNLLKDGDKMRANSEYLLFLRKIVATHAGGVTINQDLLYRILESNPKFTKTALISFSK